MSPRPAPPGPRPPGGPPAPPLAEAPPVPAAEVVVPVVVPVPPPVPVGSPEPDEQAAAITATSGRKSGSEGRGRCFMARGIARRPVPPQGSGSYRPRAGTRAETPHHLTKISFLPRR